MTKQILLALALFAALLPIACKSTGAKEGAKKGAFYGGLGSAVAGIVWGRDDVLEGAAKGAVVGGTVGAVHGGMTEREQKQKQSEKERLESEKAELEERNRELELRQRLLVEIGPENTEAVSLLVRCRHDEALVKARKSAGHEDLHFRVASRWIEVVIALDRRDVASARAVYPELAEMDPETANADEAEKKALDLVTRLEDTRAEFGLARRCP